MSWSVYDGRIEFHATASRLLASWLAFGHLLAAFAVLYAGMHSLLLPAILFSLLFSLRKALRPLGPGMRCVAWSAATGWERVHVSTNRESMELRGSSVVTNAAMFLHWEVGGSTWRVLLPRDAMQADEWRRMRVIVGFYEGRDRMPLAAGIATRAGRTLGAAPGLPEWRMDSPGFRGACPDGHKKQRPGAGREGPAG